MDEQGAGLAAPVRARGAVPGVGCCARARRSQPRPGSRVLSGARREREPEPPRSLLGAAAASPREAPRGWAAPARWGAGGGDGPSRREERPGGWWRSAFLSGAAGGGSERGSGGAQPPPARHSLPSGPPRLPSPRRGPGRSGARRARLAPAAAPGPPRGRAAPSPPVAVRGPRVLAGSPGRCPSSQRGWERAARSRALLGSARRRADTFEEFPGIKPLWVPGGCCSCRGSVPALLLLRITGFKGWCVRVLLHCILSVLSLEGYFGLFGGSVCLPVFIAGEVEAGLGKLRFALGQQVKRCEYFAVVCYLWSGWYLMQNGQAAPRWAQGQGGT